MTEDKKSFAQALQAKALAAKEAVARGAEVVAEGAQKGGHAVAHAIGEGAEKGGQAVARGAQVAGQGIQQGAEFVAPRVQQGAEMIGEGAKAGVEFVKEHPKEAAVIAGAVVVGASALPFVPGSPVVAAGVVATVAKSAMTVQEAFENREAGDQSANEPGSLGASGLIAAVAAGATAADEVLGGSKSTKPRTKK